MFWIRPLALLLGGCLLIAPEMVRAALPEDTAVGDLVEYGSYPLSEEEEKEPITWRVLKVEENEALLITEKCIDCLPFHMEMEEVTWKDCSLRESLNNGFLYSAFDEEERESIRQHKQVNSPNESFEDEEQEEYKTKDKLFLLSADQALELFSSRQERVCTATDYARDAGVYVSEINEGTFWWLRSPGDTLKCVQVVGVEGSIVISGYTVLRGDFGVRPAMWVELK